MSSRFFTTCWCFFCIDEPVTSVAGSRILIFYLSQISDPGSRIQQSNKTVGGKNLYLFCSHKFYKFHKIVNYFILENVVDPWHFDFLSLKNDVNVSSKSNKQKNFGKNLILCGHLVTCHPLTKKAGSRIRKSMVRIRGSGSVQKCHGSATLFKNSDPLTGTHIFSILIVQVSQHFRDRWLHQLAQLQDCRGCGRSTGNHQEVSRFTVRISIFPFCKYRT